MKTCRGAFERLTEDLRPEHRPALRRADEPDWLFASNIFLLLKEAEKEILKERLAREGWRWLPKGEWILLDPPLQTDRTVVVVNGPEAAACMSILERHDNKTADPVLTRLLMKASERDPETRERIFGQLHGILAERLRRGEALPDLHMERERETT